MSITNIVPIVFTFVFDLRLRTSTFTFVLLSSTFALRTSYFDLRRSRCEPRLRLQFRLRRDPKLEVVGPRNAKYGSSDTERLPFYSV